MDKKNNYKKLLDNKQIKALARLEEEIKELINNDNKVISIIDGENIDFGFELEQEAN